MADHPTGRDYPPQHPPEHHWDRQPGEGPEAYEAFATYRDQGRDRSTAAVARQLSKSKALMDRWSGEHRWVIRAAAYDRHLDGLRRREREGEILRMERAQASQLAAARTALTQPVQALLARIAERREAGEDPFAGVDTPALTRLATAAIRHMGAVVESERLVAGLSTENLRDGAPADAEEARRQAEGMSRDQLTEYLTGVDDGKRSLAGELGVELDGAGRPLHVNGADGGALE